MELTVTLGPKDDEFLEITPKNWIKYKLNK